MPVWRHLNFSIRIGTLNPQRFGIVEPHVGSVPERLEWPGRPVGHSGGASWRQESNYAVQVRGRQFEDDEWVSS